MANLSKVTSGQQIGGFPAPMYNRLVDLTNDATAGIGDGNVMPAEPLTVRVKNLTSGDRNRYSTWSLGDALWTLDRNRRITRCVFELVAYDADKPLATIQTPMKANAIGLAVVSGPTLVETTGAGSTSDRDGAPDSSGLIVPGSGPVRLASARPSGGGVILAVLGGTAGGDSHYLYTLTSSISSGTGTATIRNMADDTEIATSQSVKDPLGHMDGLASGRRGVCVKAGGVYYALTPYLVDVRWVDPDLEQSKDGTNYDNIDTAEDC